jgi:hypothetical protein
MRRQSLLVELCSKGFYETRENIYLNYLRGLVADFADIVDRSKLLLVPPGVYSFGT